MTAQSARSASGGYDLREDERPVGRASEQEGRIVGDPPRPPSEFELRAAPEHYGLASLVRRTETRARKEAADLVRAAGCLCPEMEFASLENPGVYGFDGIIGVQGLHVRDHDPRCPIALADTIDHGEKAAP